MSMPVYMNKTIILKKGFKMEYTGQTQTEFLM